MTSKKSELSFDDVRVKACDLLARREQSRFELGTKLEKSAPSQLVSTVLEELREQGLQSDSRFAEMLARSRFNRGKGPLKLRAELAEHRIDDEIVTDVMAEYEDDWQELAREVRSKKFGDRPPQSYREWARQARFLQQRGFGSQHIQGFEGGGETAPEELNDHEDN